MKLMTFRSRFRVVHNVSAHPAPAVSVMTFGSYWDNGGFGEEFSDVSGILLTIDGSPCFMMLIVVVPHFVCIVDVIAESQIYIIVLPH